jgi:hypothetical protein
VAVAVFCHRGGCRWAWRGLPFLVRVLAAGARGAALRRLVRWPPPVTPARLRDRVEAVGGSMTVDSPAGAGTVLTVLLPVTADNH